MLSIVDQARAQVRDADTIIGPLRERVARNHNGFFSNADVAWIRNAIAELGRLRTEGERIIDRLPGTVFAEQVEALREVETTLGAMLDGGRPVLAA